MSCRSFYLLSLLLLTVPVQNKRLKVVKTKPKPISTTTPSPSLPFRDKVVTPTKVSNDQISAFRKSVDAKPKLDFVFNGTEAQPSDAGMAVKGLVIGGSKAARGQFPWYCLMIMDGSSLCGGSIISAKAILTAAHCVDGVGEFLITFGGLDRSTNETGESFVTSNESTKHENFDPTSLKNDIAIVFLPNELKFNEFMRPVRLPKVSEANKTFATAKVTACGFGMTKNTGDASNVLNFVNLSVIGNDLCFKSYSTVVVSTTLCTAADPKKAICSGDSGGPLTIRDADGINTQIGIVSFGSAASCTKNPSGYTRVASFLGWIARKCNLILRP